LNQIIIRPEQTDDFAQINELLDSAFEGDDESKLVQRIRQSADYINELTLVGEEPDSKRIVGFAMLSRVLLRTNSDVDTTTTVLSLGPVAVVPSLQNQGIGGVLINEAIRLADAKGAPMIVLLGHATYYPRFGFERASANQISPPVRWDDDSYMVRKLSGWRSTIRGTIEYPPAWQIQEVKD